MGFGTGLNALLALEFASERKVRLEYTAVEAFPIDPQLALQMKYAKMLSLPERYFEYLHSAEWNKSVAISSSFTLHKCHQSIIDYVMDDSFDLIFYDAFGPGSQPDLWEEKVLKKVVDAMCQHGVFVTFCAKGEVRRTLERLGLKIERLPAPPGKREMLRGFKI